MADRLAAKKAQIKFQNLGQSSIGDRKYRDWEGVFQDHFFEGCLAYIQDEPKRNPRLMQNRVPNRLEKKDGKINGPALHERYWSLHIRSPGADSGSREDEVHNEKTNS